MKQVKITSVCDIQVGKTPSRSNPLYWGSGSLWLSIADMNQGSILSTTKETITEKGIRDCNCKIIPKNTVLFSFKLSIGKVGITNVPMYTNEAIAAFIIKDHLKLDTKFLFYVLKSVDHSIGSNKAVMGKTLNKEQLKKIEIPLPPIEDQKRIVNILDQADALRQKRKQTIGLLDDYLNTTFLEMFGDPNLNNKGWKYDSVKNITHAFSDGPFGSNLKTEHYTNSGVRVIRLGNIGINKFLDHDKYYISESHYQTIKKHSCLPGDILVATLGDPNLRACIQPNNIPIAVNKADCLLCRPNIKHVLPEYLCHLLNLPSILHKVSNLIHGQTRNRISSGQLKEITIPIPPIELQQKYLIIAKKIEAVKQIMLTQSEELENQFQALMQKAFKGTS